MEKPSATIRWRHLSQALAQLCSSPHAIATLHFGRLCLQSNEWKLLASLSALNIIQTVIIWVGLSAGLIVCVKVRMQAVSQP